MSEAPALRFTFLACQDLRRIWESIAMPTDPYSGNAPERLEQAQGFARRFSRHCELLAQNPELGAERDDLAHGLRESPFRKHVIWYRERGGVVEVVRVLRAAETA